MYITATRKVSNWFIELISELKVSGAHDPLGPTVDMLLLFTNSFESGPILSADRHLFFYQLLVW